MNNTIQNLNSAEIAAAVFESYWANKEFPVDPVYIADKINISVLIKDNVPTNVFGALVKVKGKNPVMILPKHDSIQRKRFTAAHELGHYFLRVNSDGNLDTEEYQFIDLRSDDHKNKPEEIFANKFAAELLMPEKTIKGTFNLTSKVTFKEILELSKLFGVSIEAMSYRMKNLNLF